MKRLTQAPNLALATLWADMLCDAGVQVTVQRAYSGGIAGEIPPDQSLPEIWLQDGERYEMALQLLQDLRSPRRLCWACHGCGEQVEGPFDCCWNCGMAAPEALGLP